MDVPPDTVPTHFLDRIAPLPKPGFLSNVDFLTLSNQSNHHGPTRNLGPNTQEIFGF